MSLFDRTNETIPLSLHAPQTWQAVPAYNIEAGSEPAELNVDADGDSSLDPSLWVHICWTDDEHDADRIKLTYEEAGLLHDRLGLILGRKAIHNDEVAEVRFDDGTTLAVVGEKASWDHA